MYSSSTDSTTVTMSLQVSLKNNRQLQNGAVFESVLPIPRKGIISLQFSDLYTGFLSVKNIDFEI